MLNQKKLITLVLSLCIGSFLWPATAQGMNQAEEYDPAECLVCRESGSPLLVVHTSGEGVEHCVCENCLEEKYNLEIRNEKSIECPICRTGLTVAIGKLPSASTIEDLPKLGWERGYHVLANLKDNKAWGLLKSNLHPIEHFFLYHCVHGFELLRTGETDNKDRMKLTEEKVFKRRDHTLEFFDKTFFSNVNPQTISIETLTMLLHMASEANKINYLLDQAIKKVKNNEAQNDLLTDQEKEEYLCEKYGIQKANASSSLYDYHARVVLFNMLCNLSNKPDCYKELFLILLKETTGKQKNLGLFAVMVDIKTHQLFCTNIFDDKPLLTKENIIEYYQTHGFGKKQKSVKKQVEKQLEPEQPIEEKEKEQVIEEPEPEQQIEQPIEEKEQVFEQAKLAEQPITAPSYLKKIGSLLTSIISLGGTAFISYLCGQRSCQCTSKNEKLFLSLFGTVVTPLTGAFISTRIEKKPRNQRILLSHGLIGALCFVAGKTNPRFFTRPW